MSYQDFIGRTLSCISIGCKKVLINSIHCSFMCHLIYCYRFLLEHGLIFQTFEANEKSLISIKNVCRL